MAAPAKDLKEFDEEVAKDEERFEAEKQADMPESMIALVNEATLSMLLQLHLFF